MESKSIQDVKLDDLFNFKASDDNFTIHVRSDKSILMCETLHNLKLLLSAEGWMCDTVFDIVKSLHSRRIDGSKEKSKTQKN